MQRWLNTMAFAALLAGCAVQTGEPNAGASAEASSDPAAAAPDDTALCRRLADVGPTAKGIRLHAESMNSLEAPCASIDGDRLAELGGAACELVSPRQFALVGCADSYDCGGCPVELRSDHDYGFVVTGTSTRPECLALAAKYALVAVDECTDAPPPQGLPNDVPAAHP
jgi:hypothetical protein